MKSFIRFLLVFATIITSNIFCKSEGRDVMSFSNSIKYYPIVPRLIEPFPIKIKTLCLKSSHPFWNGYSIGRVVIRANAIKKLRKIKHFNEPGLVENTIIMYHRYKDFDLQIPAVFDINWYKKIAILENANNEFKQHFIKKLSKKSKGKSGAGRGISIINTKIGETNVELNISGNISVNGALVFQEKDLITTNLRDSKSWDLEIEQTQRFSIDGNIGERFYVKIKQDSEADFSWENDLTIEYKGQKNDILQKAQAGNINLSLEGMDAVNLGGANSSLFGIKAVHQLGPVEIQSVIAREQVKKSEKTMDGGATSNTPISINDNDFIRDRYFFIDNIFKNNFYPLNNNNNHVYEPNHVIGEFEIYQKVTTAETANRINANAYLDPKDTTSYNIGGSWIKMEENIEYKIDRILGYIRLNSTPQNAIAIAYTITSFDASSQTFSSIQDSSNGTIFKAVYDECIEEEASLEECQGLIKLKLLKDLSYSTPNSPTWPLMFKNVYSIGGSNIDPSGLEIEIVRDLGGGDERTHSDLGSSYLSIFGLDSEDENHQKVDGGDGKIDLYGSLLNLSYGELMLPTYLPFAYDNIPRIDDFGNPIVEDVDTYWGINHVDLVGIFDVELNDADGDFSDDEDSGPAMYYETNPDNINEQHEFVIKVKTSSRSSSMSLGFMIVEGSETVRLGGSPLQRDIDYTIDYFSGTINFINQAALDPTAEISVSYEENEFISFDQKLLIGTHLKYAFGDKNYLAGGMFYYNQSIADEKVDIGYEPMRNFVWNVKGKYQSELGLLTRYIDFLPFIETTKPSILSIEGNYAQINPNPNPLGQAFIDDFESAKRTSSFSIMMRQWKIASPPIDLSQTIKNRGKIIWYNPYEDELTKDIWPEQSTSTRANNNTTKTLNLETHFVGDSGDSTFWNGIMIPLYSSEHDQSLTKYLDIWMNAESVQDENFLLHIDIGKISEDWNNNQKLDTEDEPVYGPGMGDGILSDGEDIGVDNCTDSYEDGWGGCLCDLYDAERFNSSLEEIYNNSTEYCLDTEAISYLEALSFMFDNPDSILVNINADGNDPNGDNWCYNTNGCNNTSNYNQANGTEGNGQAMGYRYPDSEDLDKNNTLDTQNDYFTVSFLPKLEIGHPENIYGITETISEGDPTGWKLIRIPLSAFDKIGDPSWNDVPTLRFRLESSETIIQSLKIAKIELVENDWREIGIASKDQISNENNLNEDPYFSVSVINTDESTEYKKSLDNIDIILEHDEYNDIDMKEQSLVISFENNPDWKPNDSDSLLGGIPKESAALIKNTFPSLGNNANSYFAYENMEMFVHGGNPESNNFCEWCDSDTSDVDLLFRIGKDNSNYYEVHQPIYDGWNQKNHININIDKLTQLKIPTNESPAEKLYDVGLDGCTDNIENGFGGCLDTLTFSYYCDNIDSYPQDSIINFINLDQCLDPLLVGDPNMDNWNDCGTDGNCEHIDFDGSQNNDKWDENEGFENNNYFNQFDRNGDGLITLGEAEPAIEDYNGDGIYNPHPSYDYQNEYYYWDNPNDIFSVCGNCTQLHIKGSPSINNIQTIIMGVINNSQERIYGKVLVNELRMTGVKNRKGRSYNLSGSLSFADLMTISGNYKKKDSDFHKLQQRLGTGNSDESYSATLKLHPNILLPPRWGIKMPITIGFTNSIATPKYRPGQDVLTDPENEMIENIQTKSEKISLSSSFRKSTRSTNWFFKRTIDNITINFSAIQTQNSNNQVFKELKNNYEASSSYSYNFSKENFISPFSFTKDWLIIGSILGDARYYYTPDKVSATIQINEVDSRKIQRANIDDTTKSYSFNMVRKFILNHKFTKSLSSNYTKQIDSNLDDFRFNKIEIIQQASPGLIKAINEKFTNTYAPDFLKWLNPNITYNPSYNWNLNILDTLTTANVKSSNSFKTKIGLSLKDIIELVYTPDKKNSSRSSRGRGRSSSSNKNTKKINVKNPALRLVFGGIHSIVSKFNKISATYTYTTSHDYSNISSEIIPSYLYRLGLQNSPTAKNDELFDDNIITNNNLVGASESKYGNDLNVSSSVSLTRSIVTSLDFRYSNSLSISTTSKTENESFSFYPLGIRGDEGIPISNWSINWSGIEKWRFLRNIFKSVSISHGFNGERSQSSKDENDDGIITDDELQNEQYSLNYSPIIGITTKTKGRNPVTFKANYNLNQSIKKSDQTTERNHTNQITSSISFRKSGGLTIPIFFFRDFFIPNDMDFTLSFNWNTDRQLMTSTLVTSIAEFNEQANSSTWILKPNISYSFTRWVTGNFYFSYGISENKTTGKNEEKDFGFNMNIKIQG